LYNKKKTGGFMSFQDLWQDRQTPTLSFEFYPPKNQKAEEKLEKIADELIQLQPDFVSVTFGAGGSTRKGSLDLAKKLKTHTTAKVVAYLAAYGLSQDELHEILNNLQKIKVDSVFCVRGDKPKDSEIIPAKDGFSHAAELVKFVKTHFSFCVGVAGYPEGHIEAANLAEDIGYLKEKVDCGADYIITQFFFENSFYMNYCHLCRKAGISIPIIAGIMPIYNVTLLESLAALCGTTIVDNVKSGLAKINADNKTELNDFGVGFAAQQCRELLAGPLDGLHFYTLNRSASVLPIINQLKFEGVLKNR
jgi:methylenetetrahydrofolate reductase (NADPH)